MDVSNLGEVIPERYVYYTETRYSLSWSSFNDDTIQLYPGDCINIMWFDYPQVNNSLAYASGYLSGIQIDFMNKQDLISCYCDFVLPSEIKVLPIEPHLMPLVRSWEHQVCEDPEIRPIYNDWLKENDLEILVKDVEQRKKRKAR